MSTAGRKKLLLITAAVFCVLLAIFLIAWIDLFSYADRPGPGDAVQKTFIVTRGHTFMVTTEGLYQSGFIRHPFKFRMLARIKGFDKRVQAGEYLLSSAMSPNAILKTLVEGKVNLHKMTIPEGSNIHQIAAIASEAGFSTKEAFIQAAMDSEFARDKAIDADSFEGYLFPDTYYFSKDETPRKMITAMVGRFWTAYKPEWIMRCEKLGFTIHEIVTLASIIEKETGTAFERPLISSVFHNRLKKGMRLESDPTVIYGLKNFDGNLTRKHLVTRTPYNTYKIKGLPIGPIANPGLASLEAALYPADTDYLFFVSKKDTTHKFSTNYRDHNKAIRKYQLRRKPGSKIN